MKMISSLTGQAFVRILCVLVHRVLWDSVLWDGLHLHPRSVRQHPQVLKQPLPEQSHTDNKVHFKQLPSSQLLLFHTGISVTSISEEK